VHVDCQTPPRQHRRIDLDARELVVLFLGLTVIAVTLLSALGSIFPRSRAGAVIGRASGYLVVVALPIFGTVRLFKRDGLCRPRWDGTDPVALASSAPWRVVHGRIRPRSFAVRHFDVQHVADQIPPICAS
jgi:hypothetical protein